MQLKLHATLRFCHHWCCRVEDAPTRNKPGPGTLGRIFQALWWFMDGQYLQGIAAKSWSSATVILTTIIQGILHAKFCVISLVWWIRTTSEENKLEIPAISRHVRSLQALMLSLWDYIQGSVTANQKQPTDTLDMPLRLLKHCWELPLQIWIKEWVCFWLLRQSLQAFFQSPSLCSLSWLIFLWLNWQKVWKSHISDKNVAE